MYGGVERACSVFGVPRAKSRRRGLVVCVRGRVFVCVASRNFRNPVGVWWSVSRTVFFIVIVVIIILLHIWIAFEKLIFNAVNCLLRWVTLIISLYSPVKFPLYL